MIGWPESRATIGKVPGRGTGLPDTSINKDNILPDTQLKSAQDRFSRHEPVNGRIKEPKKLFSSKIF
ncbi:hypothetical protein SCFA_2060003 [anaerobic digester metagenome]|uniref:Uncharacterized protein n=1 Tax=anaerobic digester metagenome TaxID=1263854 RepID=A0A485LZI7_9ZZZZ